jgi:hypothetical protein
MSGVAIPSRLLDEFFTEKELAAEIDKAERQVKRMRKQRTGPPWKRIGKTVLYPKTLAREWLHAGTINPVRPARLHRSRRNT